ncbi:hypothetical protein DL765_003474 [Monosporascus sp. GIB2]|nr:hypothetical protein DL765_003474 [Monosporascus sp. GIB2]
MGWNPNAPKTFRDPTAVRTFRIPNGSGKDRELLIHITEPDLKAQGLSLETWAASSVQAGLIQRLSESQMSFPSNISDQNTSTIPILELGAGTGMVGVSAAIKWQQPTVLTDLGPIVPGLAANIALNKANLSGTQMFCGALDWSQPSKLAFYPEGHPIPFSGATKAHLVLAADTIYSDEHPPLLAATILHWLGRDPAARLIMCLPLRACYLEELRDLWALLEEGGLESIETGQEMADESTFDDECLCEWSIWRWKNPEHHD